jgi:methionine synthase I (cobalamin-dependent)
MSLRAALAADRVLLLDGGTGSELRRRGLALSDDCWSASVNLERGAVLQAIHRDYIAAGADIITANTFGTTRFVLDAAGLGDDFEAVNRAAIRAARDAADSAALATEAAGANAAAVATGAAGAAGAPGAPGAKRRRVFVAASLSCMPPRFDPRAYPAAAAEYGAYRELAECFAEEGVDLVLLEMLQSAPHAERACRAVRATGLPFVAGLSCRLSPEEPRAANALVSFDDPALRFEPVLETVLKFAPDAIAIMHSPLEAMRPALDLLRTRWQGPIGAYAEIPYPEDPDGGGTARLPPPMYSAAVVSL